MEHRGRQHAPRRHRPGYGHGDRRPGGNGNGAWSSTSKATPADAKETRTNATTLLPLRTTSGGTIRPWHDNTFQGEIASARTWTATNWSSQTPGSPAGTRQARVGSLRDSTDGEV